jgi:hypothetical protein
MDVCERARIRHGLLLSALTYQSHTDDLPCVACFIVASLNKLQGERVLGFCMARLPADKFPIGCNFEIQHATDAAGFDSPHFAG